MYRQQQMPSQRLLTMPAKCLSLVIFLSWFLSRSLSISSPHLPVYPPYLFHSLAEHFYDSSGNLSTLHTESVINHLRSPTHVYHSLWLLLNFSYGGGTQTDWAKSVQSSSVEGGSFCHMPLWCQNETQVQTYSKHWETFHLIQWQHFPIVYVAHGINEAVM